MTTIKSYTDISQSKTLSKILPLESSDMVYLRCDFEDEGKYSILVGSYHEGYTEREDGTIVPVFDEHIPAWSLVALLGVLPTFTIGSSDDHYYRVHCMKRYTEWYDNPVDACYELILKLHKLKML